MPAAASLNERIWRDRTALPSHALEVSTESVRLWATAACSAELEHAERETRFLAHKHGLLAVIDEHEEPFWDEAFRLLHERQAARVLSWLVALAAVERRMAETADESYPGRDADLADLEVRRGKIDASFLRAVEAYKDARTQHEVRV